MGLIIKCYPLGPLQENTYLLIDEDTDEKSVIDPGYYGELVINDIGDINSLKYIILTHAHFDHFASANKYLNRYNSAKLVGPSREKYLLNKDWKYDFMTRGYDFDDCPQVDIFVSEDDVIKLGNSEISFIETPGHTEGSICILSNNILFSGDTLFKFSVGNTTFETGSWDDLIHSIKNKLYLLNDEIIVYPGHGPCTTIGDEKRGNPFV